MGSILGAVLNFLLSLLWPQTHLGLGGAVVVCVALLTPLLLGRISLTTEERVEEIEDAATHMLRGGGSPGPALGAPVVRTLEPVLSELEKSVRWVGKKRIQFRRWRRGPQGDGLQWMYGLPAEAKPSGTPRRNSTQARRMVEEASGSRRRYRAFTDGMTEDARFCFHALAQWTIFGGQELQLLAQLARGASRVECEAGEELFRAGEPLEDLYVLLQGEVHAVAPSPAEDDDDVVSRIHSGGVVSSMLVMLSFLTGRAAVAAVTARCAGRCALLRVPALSAVRASPPAQLPWLLKKLMMRVNRVTLMTIYGYLGIIYDLQPGKQVAVPVPRALQEIPRDGILTTEAARAAKRVVREALCLKDGAPLPPIEAVPVRRRHRKAAQLREVRSAESFGEEEVYDAPPDASDPWTLNPLPLERTPSLDAAQANAHQRSASLDLSPHRGAAMAEEAPAGPPRKSATPLSRGLRDDAAAALAASPPAAPRRRHAASASMPSVAVGGADCGAWSSKLQLLFVEGGRAVVDADAEGSPALYIVLKGELELRSNQDQPLLFKPRASFRGLSSVLRPLGSAAWTQGAEDWLEGEPGGRVLARHGPGAMVGQLSLITESSAAWYGSREGKQGLLSVIAAEDSWVLRLPRDVHEAICERDGGVVLRAAERLISNLPPLLRIFDFGCRWVVLDAGDVLHREGQPCRGDLHVVLSGCLRSTVRAHAHGAPRRDAAAGRGRRAPARGGWDEEGAAGGSGGGGSSRGGKRGGGGGSGARGKNGSSSGVENDSKRRSDSDSGGGENDRKGRSGGDSGDAKSYNKRRSDGDSGDAESYNKHRSDGDSGDAENESKGRSDADGTEVRPHHGSDTDEARSPRHSSHSHGGGYGTQHRIHLGDGRSPRLHHRSSGGGGTAHKLLAELGRGALVGESEVLTREPYSTTITASRHSSLARVPGSLLSLVVKKQPRVLAFLAQHVSRKMSLSLRSGLGPKARRFDAGGCKTLMVVPISPSVPLDNFCQTLCAALERLGLRARLVSSGEAAGSVGLPGGAEAFKSDDVGLAAEAYLTTSGWLSQREELNDVLVYQADWSAESQWNHICGGCADRTLLVANAADSPGVMPLEQELDVAPAQATLVLLHVLHSAKAPPNLRPKASRLWIEARGGVASHVHVRLHAQHSRYDREHYRSDFMRLARVLTNRAVGLVLGGGGARGMAHLSVIRCLEESDIPIDMVCGTSIGSFVGALYAGQPEYLGIRPLAHAFARRMSETWHYVADVTWPVVSYFSAAGFNFGIMSFLRREAKIEDLWLNYSCVTTDIASGESLVHRNGTLWRYVRASMSLAGYLPPLCDEDPRTGALHYLVDGGYMNVLPADVMDEVMGAGIVIACDVQGEWNVGGYNYGDQLNGWRVLLSRLNPFGKGMQVPSMAEISDHLTFVASARTMKEVRERHIDLYLNPPVQRYSTLDFKAYHEIEGIGYAYAKDVIKAWKASVLRGGGVKASILNAGARRPRGRRPSS